MPNLLNGKHALIFGAGGSIGSAVAKEFAAEGAEVFLSGRTNANIEAVAREIRATGGRAHVDLVDTLDDASVNEYVDGVAKQIDRIDVVFNAVGPRTSEYANGQLAVNLTVEQFMLPLATVLKAQFISARAAARHMMQQRSGTIIFLTGSPARGHVSGVTAIGTAFGAIETFAENLALEVGSAGVRAVCLRTMANVDSRTIQETLDVKYSGSAKEERLARLASLNFLKVPATTTDTAKLAAFLASDRARMMTGTVVNATAGSSPD
jgi:3-oxoacyl-[acyl-carrier protein] reductase